MILLLFTVIYSVWQNKINIRTTITKQLYDDNIIATLFSQANLFNILKSNLARSQIELRQLPLPVIEITTTHAIN